MTLNYFTKALLFILMAFICPAVFAQDPSASFPIQLDQNNIAPALQIFGALTVLSLAPGILMMLTSFTRNIVVLSILRNALGLQQTPPNIVLISLALFLTLFTMMPVAKVIYDDAWQPLQEKKISLDKALENSAAPLKKFMLNQTQIGRGIWRYSIKWPKNPCLTKKMR